MKSRFRQRGRLALSGLALGALMLTGCTTTGTGSSPSDDGEPVYGGNINIQLPADPQSLDLVTVNTPSNGAVAAMVFDHLFERDEQFQAQPSLVDDWEVSEDGLLYTFTLREGITWHDGDPLTAKDPVATITRWMQLSGAGRTAAPTIDAVEVVDDLTFTIKLNTRRYGLEQELASSGLEIYKAEILEASDATGFTRDQVVGTGPYMLESWDSQKLVLARYDDYVSREEDPSGNAGAKRAYLDTITYLFVGEDNAIVSGLQTGLWDVATMSNEQFDVISAEPGVDIIINPGASINTFAPNMSESSVFSDPVARQALNLLVDKEALIAATGGAQGLVVAESAFAPADRVDLYSTEGRDTYDGHDPDEAKRLFEQAGVDHIRIITTNTFPQIYQWSVLLQDQLAAIGIGADIQAYDYASMLALLAEQPDAWDLTMLAFNGNVPTPATMNMLTRPWGSFQTPELKQLIVAYSESLTAEEAREAVDDLQGYIWDNLSQIVISHAKTWTAVSDRVGGYVYGRSVGNAWIKSEE